MMRLTRVLAVCAAVLAGFAASGFAEAGRNGGQILGRAIGARSNGMGQAFCAVTGDVESVIYNPAGTAYISSPTVSMTYLRGLAQDGNGFIGFSYNLFGVVLTPSVLYYNSGKITLNLSNGDNRTVTAQEDRVGMFTVAARPLSFLGVGATVKYSQLKLADTAEAKGTHFDVGAVAHVIEGLKVGLSHQNNGSDIKYETVGDPPPVTTRAGISYEQEFTPPNLLDASADLMYFDLIVAADIVNIKNEGSYYHTGLELNMNSIGDMFFSLRGGYMFQHSLEGLTLGAGLRQDSWNLDYAYGNASEMNSRHQFTISYKF